MIIGTDLDGVLCNLHATIYERVVEQHPDCPMPNDWTTYPFQVGGYVPEGWVDELFIDPAFWLSPEPFDEAWEWLYDNWFDMNEIHIITARKKYGEAVRLTQRWLQSHDLIHNSVHFVEDRFDKIDLIKELGCEFFIEDDPLAARQISDVVETYLIDRPYNRQVSIGKAKRIKTIKDIDALRR